jgi:23S rRNA (cytidine1920-2'-O)/16S rRNA (cytidine1409-2'-O)-methyltransferase
MRLDQLLVERRLFESRSRARDAVMRGTVSVAGAVASKPGLMVPADADLEVADAAQHYVSRAALKLLHGLDHFGLDPRDSRALDIGASTGGFTQVLLERGAAQVTAIDVGHGQPHPAVAGDPRVTNIEGLNARDLSLAAIKGVAPDFLVCDVSFISLRPALPAALELAAPGARGVFLVKPQFEVGRQAIGKGGLLRDPVVGARAAQALCDWLPENGGWRALGLTQSPIAGGDGNREFLLAGVKEA